MGDIGVRVLLHVIEFGSRQRRHHGKGPNLPVGMRVGTSHHGTFVLDKFEQDEKVLAITQRERHTSNICTYSISSCAPRFW
jgi:hypothetical protein